MPARSIPRPASTPPIDSAAVLTWLEYLTISSSCRGLRGHELSRADGLLGLTFLEGEGGPGRRAGVLRGLIHAEFQRDVWGSGGAASLQLLGLTRESALQPRATRRYLAWRAYETELSQSAFQKSYERLLLMDVADFIWEVELAFRGERLFPLSGPLLSGDPTD